MKKQILVALMGAALIAPIAAFAQGPYVGVNVGRADHKLTFEGDAPVKDDTTAYKLYGGYGFNQNFGIEGGYTHFGKYTDSWVDGADAGTDTVKAHAFYVAATGTLPLSEQFSLFAKAGVAFNRVKMHAEDNAGNKDSFSKNRTTPLLGIGAAYNFSKNMAIVAEYENYGKTLKFDDVQLKTSMVSVGLRYKF